MAQRKGDGVNMDTSQMPMPDAGWSREIPVLNDAIVWPAGEMRRVQMCGLTHSDGRDVPEGALFRGDTRLMTPVVDREPPTARLSGRHIWGGQVFAHFGHFLTESISRLWAVKNSDAESLILIGKHENLVDLSKWQKRFLEIMEIDKPITFIREPTRIETLEVPGQGFGLGPIALGTPEFRASLNVLERTVAPQGAEKIYISRTKTGKKGRILNEVALEANLIAQGYTAYHPQEHSLEDQLAQYRAATHVIGLDSSAFHLLGLVARPDQKIAVILRRNMMAYINIERQLTGMLGRRPDIINTLLGDWMPPGQKAANRLSWGQVDHALLGQRLTELGYIDMPDRWAVPTEAEFNVAFAKFKKRFGGEVVFRPVDEPIEKMIEHTF
ncbi:glycosyltransferase family 61 protein [Falsirhodobacter halotolerans]|uniref:glycosyltransferase family 61 protein n=1 Tax=Falsirhodobacter halotolerans TaxID=1146892 RepID=UPI001FD116D8|nr:glycosyltransferase 61 family protein [Falsirhodobacter halotolerans]MCJ8138983.1 glycosyltransferase family 61 protein [Falsirhodobacter halotolerans]